MIEQEQIEAEHDKASGAAAEQVNPWPAMTYVEGVRDALAWVMGYEEDGPLDELDD